MIKKEDYEKIVGKRIRYDILYKYETVVKIIKKYKKGKLKVLDVGCGYGIFCFYADRKWFVYGVDSDEERISRARKIKLKNCVFIKADAEKLKLKKKFDAIVALDILEHLKRPEKCLEKIYGMLKDDGIFIVSNPNRHSLWAVLFDNKIIKLETHRNYWSPEEFGRMAEEFGFRLVEVVPRPLFSEGIGWILPDYRIIVKLDDKLGKIFPKLCTGWFLILKK
ncbi:MAG: class I SAM-dependent methyltransferase [Candidatus Aenigmatarchaeota archaeon]